MGRIVIIYTNRHKNQICVLGGNVWINHYYGQKNITSKVHQGTTAFSSQGPLSSPQSNSVQPPETLSQYPTYLTQHKGKEIENKLKSQQILNLRKYPFCRAVHYFYPLDDFPRLSGHVSYAVDHNNALGNTFPRDK